MKKQQKKYGPGGKYYRKRIKRPDGKWEDVYGLTQTELSEKVTVRRAQLAAEAAGTPEDPFVYEYAAGWYSRRAPFLSPAAQQLYRDQINKVICPVIGQKPMREVTSDDVAAVLATRGHLSRSSQKKTIMVLKQIFDAALEAGVIEKLPTRRIRAEGKAPEQKKALTPAQQDALLAAVRGLAVEPMVWLGLYTGMRREEICGLRWDSVQLDGKAPHVTVRRACRWPDHLRPEVSEILKTAAAARTIPIPPQLVDYLRDLRAAQLAALPKRKNTKKAPLSKGGSGEAGGGLAPAQRILSLYVYSNDDGSPVSYSTLRRRWETIKARSTASGHALGEKIPHSPGGVTVTLDVLPTPHILRHTYITRLILGGMDLKRVQYLAGHSDPKVTIKIYTDLMGHAPEDLIDDVAAIFAPAKPAGECTP